MCRTLKEKCQMPSFVRKADSGRSVTRWKEGQKSCETSPGAAQEQQCEWACGPHTTETGQHFKPEKSVTLRAKA